MKKKLTISVADLINKNSSNQTQTPKLNILSSKQVQKPIKFEDMYRQVIASTSQPTKNSHYIFSTHNSTPSNTQRVKKGSINNILVTKSHTNTPVNKHQSTTSSANPSQKQSPQIKKSAKQTRNKQNRNNDSNSIHVKKQKGITKQNNTKKYQRLDQEGRNGILQKFDRFIKDQVDHKLHSHLRKSECFLSESQIFLIFEQLGYNTAHFQFRQILKLIEVDMYGGAPSMNIRKIISIIEGGHKLGIRQHRDMEIPHKIIDSNLEIVLDEKEMFSIYSHFLPFKCTRNTKTQTKLQITPKRQSIKSNYQVIDFPATEIFSQFNATHLNHKQNKLEEENKPQNQVEHILPLQNQDEKIISQEKTEKLEEHDTADIITLKNRLNEALRKSSNITPSEQEQTQSGCQQKQTFYRYGTKPILSVDVNLWEGVSEKIIVYEGESAKVVSQKLAAKFNLTEQTRLKFQRTLDAHLTSMLWKIDQVSEEMWTDRDID